MTGCEVFKRKKSIFDPSGGDTAPKLCPAVIVVLKPLAKANEKPAFYQPKAGMDRSSPGNPATLSASCRFRSEVLRPILSDGLPFSNIWIFSYLFTSASCPKPLGLFETKTFDHPFNRVTAKFRTLEPPNFRFILNPPPILYIISEISIFRLVPDHQQGTRCLQVELGKSPSKAGARFRSCQSLGILGYGSVYILYL